MIQAILTFLKVIPDILVLLKEVNKFIKENFSDTPDKFVKDAKTSFKEFNEAKTQDDKDKAFKKIHSLFDRI